MTFSWQPTAAGLEVEGCLTSPGEAFLMIEWLSEYVAGVAERDEDGAIRELVPRKNWAINLANKNLAEAGSEERL